MRGRIVWVTTGVGVNLPLKTLPLSPALPLRDLSPALPLRDVQSTSWDRLPC